MSNAQPSSSTCPLQLPPVTLNSCKFHHFLLVNYSEGKSFPSCINICPSLHFFPRFPLVKVKQPEACSLFLLFPSVSKWLHTNTLGGMKRSLSASAHPLLLPCPVVSPSRHVYVWLLTPVAEEFFNVLCSVKYFHGHFSTAYLYSALHPGFLMKAWKVDKGFPNQIYHATLSDITSILFNLLHFK